MIFSPFNGGLNINIQKERIPRAEASSIGAAATIVKASTVTCNPYIIAGATLIALGVYAGVDSGAFETVANNCVDALEAAGTWVKDGLVELLRTEDADGNASYYVDSGLMEDVRAWSCDYVVPYVTTFTEISFDLGSFGSYHITSNKDFFPFCIPFDLFDFLTVLSAEPQAPVFKWEIPVPQLGRTFELEVDLSPWDPIASLFRTFELLAFIVGLALITREKFLRS